MNDWNQNGRGSTVSEYTTTITYQITNALVLRLVLDVPVWWPAPPLRHRPASAWVPLPRSRSDSQTALYNTTTLMVTSGIASTSFSKLWFCLGVWAWGRPCNLNIYCTGLHNRALLLLVYSFIKKMETCLLRETMGYSLDDLDTYLLSVVLDYLIFNENKNFWWVDLIYNNKLTKYTKRYDLHQVSCTKTFQPAAKQTTIFPDSFYKSSILCFRSSSWYNYQQLAAHTIYCSRVSEVYERYNTDYCL